MSVIKILLISIIILTGLGSFSQSYPITIKGKFDNLKGRHPIYVSKPVDHFFCKEYIELKDSAFLENERFQLQLNITAHSFIRLQIDQLGSLVCYVDSASNINFQVMTDSNAKPERVFFFGANAEANELMANGQLLNSNGRESDLITSIIKHAKNSSVAIDSLQLVLSKYSQNLHDLYSNHKISVDCYNTFIAETEQRLLFGCKDLLRQSLNKPTLIKMSNKELKIFILKLFSQFDPFNKKYFKTTIISDNIIAKCILINDGIIPAVIPNPRDTWRSYSGDFSFYVPYIGTYDFAPNYLQQYLAGNALLTALSVMPLTKVEFMDLYQTYQKLYPFSPYIPIVNDWLTIKVFPTQNNTKVKLDFQY